MFKFQSKIFTFPHDDKLLRIRKVPLWSLLPHWFQFGALIELIIKSKLSIRPLKITKNLRINMHIEGNNPIKVSTNDKQKHKLAKENKYYLQYV